MYPQRRKRNIKLISDEERRKLHLKEDEDTWGKLEDEDFEEFEEGEEILLESDEEKMEVEVDDDEWLEDGDIEEEDEIINELTHETIYEEDTDSLLAENSIVEPQVDSQNVFLIDGKPFEIKLQNAKPTFQESHTRITTYIEKNLHQIIKMLLAQNQIKSITKLINDSVKDYLMNRYDNDN